MSIMASFDVALEAADRLVLLPKTITNSASKDDDLHPPYPHHLHPPVPPHHNHNDTLASPPIAPSQVV